jgi:hypothetical protein
MPYVSKAQQKWAHTDDAKEKGFPTAENDIETAGLELPEHARDKTPASLRALHRVTHQGRHAGHGK